MRSNKCAWMLLEYVINNRKNPFSIKNHDQYHLSITDDDGIRRNIERYSYDDPREYLGVTQTAKQGDDQASSAK